MLVVGGWLGGLRGLFHVFSMVLQWFWLNYLEREKENSWSVLEISGMTWWLLGNITRGLGKLLGNLTNNTTYLPYHQNLLGKYKAVDQFPKTLSSVGDKRVTENLGLSALHTVFLREHNRLVTKLGKLNPHWDGEKLYQESRNIIAAMTQVVTTALLRNCFSSSKCSKIIPWRTHGDSKFSLNLMSFLLQLLIVLPLWYVFQIITYRDYIPLLLAEETSRWIPSYSGYNESVDPTVSNVFSLAFRFGHASVQPFVSRLDDSFQPMGSLSHVPLHLTFCASWRIIMEGKNSGPPAVLIRSWSWLSSADMLVRHASIDSQKLAPFI